MTDHEQWDELAAGYALHGLAPDEEIVFEAHLETCELCAASMNDHEMVAAQLGSIAHYRETDGEAPSWDSMRSLIVGDRAATADIIDLAARRRRYELSRRTLSAAAAVVIVAGGGVATWQLTTGGSNCSASAGCHAIQLDAAGGKKAASVTVRDTTVTMQPNGMSAAPAGDVYVLWQQPRDGHATPIGTFSGGKGAPATDATLKVAYSDTQGFAVSAENALLPTPSTPSNLLASGVAS